MDKKQFFLHFNFFVLPEIIHATTIQTHVETNVAFVFWTHFNFFESIVSWCIDNIFKIFLIRNGYDYISYISIYDFLKWIQFNTSYWFISFQIASIIMIIMNNIFHLWIHIGKNLYNYLYNHKIFLNIMITKINFTLKTYIYFHIIYRG